MPRLTPDPFDAVTPVGRSHASMRFLLGAGLSFMEGARDESFQVASLRSWMQRCLIGPGLMVMPTMVQEVGVGAASLDEASTSGRVTSSSALRVGRIIAASRARCAAQLGGLVARPPDDRFLSAAIFGGRVQRASGQRGPMWQPTPQPTDRLSDIVLSLFAADILSNREEYDAHLCVCDTCGAVCFTQHDRDLRDRCDEHTGPEFT